MAFVRWLLSRHDLAFSQTILNLARRDQERAAAQARREHSARELEQAVQARATGKADLGGPGRALVRQALTHTAEAVAERKAAAARAEQAARTAVVARARRRREGES